MFEDIDSEEGEENDDSTAFALPDKVWEKMSVSWKMEKLKSAKVTGPISKLRVDEEDILTDAVAFYKSPAFDATKPLRISFSDQPAIDTGGVLREFFSTVKEKFITGGTFKMFEGSQERLLFNYEQSCLAAGIPQILGKIVAQSLIHGCGGFPHLAPSHFYYIATGDIQKASAYTSVYDVYDTEKREVLEQVLLKFMYSIYVKLLDCIPVP